jgi:hypothetical protein
MSRGISVPIITGTAENASGILSSDGTQNNQTSLLSHEPKPTGVDS